MAPELPKTELSVHRPFFSNKARVHFSVLTSIRPSQLAQFGFECRELAKSLIHKNTLLQIKGRDEKSPLTIPSADAPLGDELFYYSVQKPSCESDINHLSGDPAFFSLITKFQGFPSAGSISHSVQEYSSHPEIGETLVWGAPIIPQNLRCGVEFFESSRASSLLSSIPTVRERVWIEASQNKLSITFHSEQLKEWKIRPLSNDDFYKKLISTLKSAANLDIEALYKIN